MPYPLPLTRTEAYLAYKAGVIQQSDLKPSLAVPRNGIDAWLAYWTGLAADYPKREDGTPHILQEEEAYIAYLCGVINEYPEKCLRRVGAYLRYLISARWGRPDHPLNREELYLSLIKTQFIPSGDPSSDIEIDGTTKAPFLDVKMYGDTFQQTYSGKNLLFIRDTMTSSGVTFRNNGDGSITINGTSTGNVYFLLNNDAQHRNTLKAGKTYTISAGTPDGKLPNNVRLYTRGAQESGFEIYNDIFGSTTTNATKTIQTDVETFTLVAVYGAGVVLDNLTIYPMLEESSSKTDFEPYVGNTISPNPEYPQLIHTVTGEQTVEVRGKNLVDSSQLGFTAGGGGVTITKEADGSFTINGTSTDRYNNYRYDATEMFSALVGETVTVSVRTTGSGSWRNFGLKSSSDLLIVNLSEGQKTGVVPESSLYLVDFYFINGVTFNNYNVKLQIEKGSTATSFEPYSKHTYDINLGKNLIIGSDTFENFTDLSFWSLSTEKFNGRDVYTRSDVWHGCYKELTIEKNVEYTFSFYAKCTTNRGANIYIQGGTVLYNDLDRPDHPITLTSEWARYTATFKSSKSGTIHPRVELSNSSQSGTISISSFQFEYGDKATSYAPYFDHIGKNVLGTNWGLYSYTNSGVRKDDSGAYGTVDLVKVEPSTQYIISRGGFGVAMNVFEYDASKTFIKRYNLASDVSFTTSATTRYVAMFRSQTGGIEKMQLEKGNSITPYEPFVKPELCKLGDYQDYIWKDGNDWKIHKDTAKYVFETASGVGANWEASNHRVYFTVNYQNTHHITFAEYTDTTTQAPLLADKFKAISFDDLYVNGESGIALSSTKTLSIRNNNWTDETTARNEITGTTMYYALATATDITITYQPLIDQLDALVNGGAENDTTYIKVNAADPNLPGLLYVEAPKYE